MKGAQDEAFEMAITLNGGVRPDYVSGDYMCRCPGHADASPSLAVRWTGRRLMYHCYANCEFAAIARGIREYGLDPITGQRLGAPRADRPVRPPPPDPEAEFLRNHVYEPYVEDWLKDRRAFEILSDSPDVHRYVYRDLEGRPVMTVTRSLKPHRFKPGLHKVFVAVTPWRNKLTGRLDMPFRAAPEPRTPYGAETIRRAGEFVLVGEGEKCRDALEHLCGGAMPTISSYGSAPYLTDLTSIGGRTMIISRDSDDPGRRFAAAIASEHTGPSYVIEGPPNDAGQRPPGWDVADWLHKTAGPTPAAWAEYVQTQLPDDVAARFAAAIQGAARAA